MNEATGEAVVPGSLRLAVLVSGISIILPLLYNFDRQKYEDQDMFQFRQQ